MVDVENENFRAEGCHFLENTGLNVKKWFDFNYNQFFFCLGRRRYILLLRQSLLVAGGLQLRQQLCKTCKKLESFMKRVPRSLTLYLSPSPLERCLMAWLAGERD
jgi:hypothetical protein